MATPVPVVRVARPWASVVALEPPAAGATLTPGSKAPVVLRTTASVLTMATGVGGADTVTLFSTLFTPPTPSSTVKRTV